ncbi:MAG: prepilin-type N-terminal cleavage/methylation domain-containing protein [Sedimentisphaerales bacterium]|nr:prepilin-type N-terminal cleavage/methylation domain-containing protein [Sedimentisphaerales bacterium]
MRKGFTLVEVLVIVAITPILAVALSGMFRVFVRDIPQGARLLQQNTSVLDMLGNVRRDVDRAVALPQRFQDVQTDDHRLLVELPEGTVSYELRDGEVARTTLSPNSAAAPEQRLWSVPKAVVTWKPWKQDQTAYAVEVHTTVQHRIRGKWHNKFANSHVFFLRGLGKDQAIK